MATRRPTGLGLIQTDIIPPLVYDNLSVLARQGFHPDDISRWYRTILKDKGQEPSDSIRTSHGDLTPVSDCSPTIDAPHHFTFHHPDIGSHADPTDYTEDSRLGGFPPANSWNTPGTSAVQGTLNCFVPGIGATSQACPPTEPLQRMSSQSSFPQSIPAGLLPFTTAHAQEAFHQPTMPLPSPIVSNLQHFYPHDTPSVQYPNLNASPYTPNPASYTTGSFSTPSRPTDSVAAAGPSARLQQSPWYCPTDPTDMTFPPTPFQPPTIPGSALSVPYEYQPMNHPYSSSVVMPPTPSTATFPGNYSLVPPDPKLAYPKVDYVTVGISRRRKKASKSAKQQQDPGAANRVVKSAPARKGPQRPKADEDS